MTPNPQDSAVALEVERVYLVATGETHEGQETYTRHDVRPPLCDAEVLYTRASQSDGTSGVPEGWKLVPVEPTDAMIRAGYDAENNDGKMHLRPAWRYMLAAAPAAPNQGENHVG